MNIHLVTGTANPVYIHLFRQSLAKYTDYPYTLHIIADNGVEIAPPDVGDTITRLGKGFHGVGHNWNLGIEQSTGADWWVSLTMTSCSPSTGCHAWWNT